MYKEGADTETGIWDEALVVLGIRVVFAIASLGWFDPAKDFWAFLQKQEFDLIMAKLEQVVQTLDRGLMICKTFY